MKLDEEGQVQGRNKSMGTYEILPSLGRWETHRGHIIGKEVLLE